MGFFIVWVGLGDGGSQARVCLFVFSFLFFILRGTLGWVFAFWVHSSSTNTVAAGPGSGGHQALLP